MIDNSAGGSVIDVDQILKCPPLPPSLVFPAAGPRFPHVWPSRNEWRFLIRRMASRVGPRSRSRMRPAVRAFIARDAHLLRQLFQRSDAIFRRWMGRKQVVHAPAGERIDDEQMRDRGISFGRLVFD